MTASSRREWRSRRRSPNVAIILAGTVGAIAIAGGYLGSTASSPGTRSLPNATSPPAAPTAVVLGAYAPEVGPFALPWIWLSDRGAVTVQGVTSETGYLAFLALSLRRPRTMRIGDSPGQRIGVVPRAYLVGPIDLTASEIPIRVSPGAERASGKDSRRLSVFLSTPIVSSKPFVAIPGQGFYPEERVDGRQFNWMTERGVLELVAPSALDGPVVIRLRLWSATARRVRIERGGTAGGKTVGIAARRVELVVVGGIRMRSGRGRVTLTTELPARTGRDRRRLALQLLGATRIL